MKVRHQPLLGIGDLFELDTASGPRITITNYRSGRRDVAIGDPGAEEPLATTGLTRADVVRQLDGTTRAPVAWDHFVGVSTSATR
jgi:hypothetical protein